MPLPRAPQLAAAAAGVALMTGAATARREATSATDNRMLRGARTIEDYLLSLITGTTPKVSSRPDSRPSSRMRAAPQVMSDQTCVHGGPDRGEPIGIEVAVTPNDVAHLTPALAALVTDNVEERAVLADDMILARRRSTTERLTLRRSSQHSTPSPSRESFRRRAPRWRWRLRRGSTTAARCRWTVPAPPRLRRARCRG